METLCNTRKLSLDQITTLSAGDPNDGADYCASNLRVPVHTQNMLVGACATFVYGTLNHKNRFF